jgi:hypothetical protein
MSAVPANMMPRFLITKERRKRWLPQTPYGTLLRYHDFFLVPPFLFPQKNPLQPQRRWHQVRILLQHSLTDSMRHAPGRLIRHAKRPMKLPSANRG